MGVNFHKPKVNDKAIHRNRARLVFLLNDIEVKFEVNIYNRLMQMLFVCICIDDLNISHASGFSCWLITLVK